MGKLIWSSPQKHFYVVRRCSFQAFLAENDGKVCTHHTILSILSDESLYLNINFCMTGLSQLMDQLSSQRNMIQHQESSSLAHVFFFLFFSTSCIYVVNVFTLRQNYLHRKKLCANGMNFIHV